MKWTKVVVVGADAGAKMLQAIQAMGATPAGARQHLVPGFEIRLHVERGRLPANDTYEFFASPEARIFLSAATMERGAECDKPTAPIDGSEWTIVMTA